MGKYKNGINGPFTGKVGNVVGTTWKGIAVLRSKPYRRTRPFTEGELRQQARFRLINQFLNPLIPLFKQTFQSVGLQMTEYNRAVSYNIKNAITGIYPELEIDYAAVLVGRGDLTGASSYALDSPAPGQVQMTWANNAGKGKARADDRVYTAFYCAETDRWTGDQVQAATRASESLMLDYSHMTGNTLQAYLGFISAEGNEVSDSVYLGSLKI